jgi:hypothetical protein
VAKEVEDNPPAVGRQVRRHPRSFTRREVDLACLAARQRDVPPSAARVDLSAGELRLSALPLRGAGDRQDHDA